MPEQLSSAEYFERYAGDWDALRAGFFTEALRDEALAQSYLRPEMVAADIGAGTGFLAEALAGRTAHVHLVDASPAMLAEARRKLRGIENASFHLAEGRSIPLPDESVDVVFANMYLHHCPDPQAAIAEMARLLRPGGRIVLTDLDEHGYDWLQAEMADEWPGFSRAQVRGWLRQAGLVNVRVRDSGQDCCGSSAAGDPARISVFLASGTRRIDRLASVSAHYGLHAEGGKSCCGPSPAAAYTPLLEEPASGCCGPATSSCCAPAESQVSELGYSPAEQALAPPEAADFSLGCGNPLALASLQPGEVVVDIGSGGGFDAFLAAKKVGPRGRVIGVDPTPAMLERARRSAAAHGYTNVEFRPGQAEALPVADASADVVISNCVINLAEDKGAAFGEAFRALRPGGRLEVSDIAASGALPASEQMDEESWAACVSGALPESEYLDLIRQAGFEQVHTARRAAAGEAGGVRLYSVIVRAVKPR